MKNKILILAVIALLAVPLFYLSNVSAKNADAEDNILPEEDGTYNVPGRPDLKLRVIVHHQKPSGGDTSTPVCYLPDPDSLATVAQAGWKLPAGIWVYTLNVNSVPSSVGSANLATMAADALLRWSNATANTVLFSRDLANTTVNRAKLDSKNIITWGRTQGTALAITYTWYNPGTGYAVESDIIMNNKFKWTWSDPLTWTDPSTTCANSSTYDAQDILTHELGHWMGLNDMYDAVNYQNATMYGYGSKAEIKKDTLSTGDLAGISAIY